MPVSRSFKDLSITFGKNPVTDDVIVTKDFNAIKQSINNLLLTAPGERFFNPNIGSRISQVLFEPLDFIGANLVRSEIFYTIQAFEPRVELIEVDVSIDYDNNGYDIDIEYRVVGLPEKTNNIEIFLERTRA